VGVRTGRDFCDVDGDDVDEEKEKQRKERRQWWR
jgi:hypothetical protein